jgi:hypothetical protein
MRKQKLKAGHPPRGGRKQPAGRTLSRGTVDRILSRHTEIADFRVTHDFPRIGRRVLALNARRLLQERGAPELMLLAMEDCTEGGSFRKAAKLKKTGRNKRA